jgi:preprotein translocase subunit YajC
MWSSSAYAQTAGGAAAGGAGSLINILPLVLLLVIFYFFLIRPQQKRLKEHRAMIEAVKRGDTVVTGGGLIGKVSRVEDAEVEVELAPNVKVKVVKATLTEVRNRAGAPANDTDKK